MREMKFRIMLGKTWHYWGFIEGKTDYIFAGIPNSNVEPMTMKEAMERSQQYTNLKDKNGKEIYEGDIIEFKQYVIDSNNKVNPNKFKTVVQEVKFESSIITQGFNVYKAFSDRCEIIGNIYENPELLKWPMVYREKDS